MLPDYVRALLDPSIYPQGTPRVELVQTHISYVLLAGEHVFKLKKAIDLGFLDFSRLEARRHFCEEEVRLNSRLCPALYYGVEPIVRAAGRYRIGGAGEVVDYAVHMRRLPAAGMMEGLVERGQLTFALLGRLAERLARFHAEAAQGEEIARIGGFDTFAAHWLDNFDQLRPYVGRTIADGRFQRLHAYADTVLDRDQEMFRKREAEGRVRDCHGDLRCESVCFDFPAPGDVCISDCIEFSEAYRCSDTGLDVGFLAMDLEARGRADLADVLVGLYCAAAGDSSLPLVLRAFKSYRALVRGKVNSLISSQSEVPAGERLRARRQAAVFFRLAESYARGRPGGAMVLVMGLTGSGKSVLAGAVASRLYGALLATDIIRKELFGLEPTEHVRSDYGAGIYSAEATDRVYREVAARARRFMEAGATVVLDGTYLRRRQRAPAVDLARARGAKLLVIECWAPEGVIAARHRARTAEAWTTSDATWEHYLAQKAMVEPDEINAGHRIVVDTTSPIARQMAEVQAALAAIRPRRKR